MSSLEKGTKQLRMAFLFKVYDTDKGKRAKVLKWFNAICVDGGISKEELQEYFLSSLLVTINEDIKEVSQYFVDRVFKQIGLDADGKLTEARVQDYIKNNPDITDVYSLFGRSMTTQQVPKFFSLASVTSPNVESIRIEIKLTR